MAVSHQPSGVSRQLYKNFSKQHVIPRTFRSEEPAFCLQHYSIKQQIPHR